MLGEPAGEQSAGGCLPFDYENGLGYCSAMNMPGTDTGHYTGCVQGAAWRYRDGNRLFFKVCDCDEAGDIIHDDQHRYRIKVRILTDGVYWNARNCSSDSDHYGTEHVMLIRSFEDLDSACLCHNDDNATSWFEMMVLNYLDAGGNNIDHADMLNTCVEIDDCEVPPGARAKTIITDTYTGSQLFREGAPLLEIDLPSLVYDNGRVARGDDVRMKICIQEGDSICIDCTDICCCTVSAGTLGCPGPQKCQIVFPYITPPDDIDWSTGMAIVNSGNRDGMAHLTFYDAGGGTGTKEIKISAHGMFVDLVNNIVNDLDEGATLDLSRRLFLVVVPDFHGLHGLAMVADHGNQTGMGYRPVNCCRLCY